MLFGQDADGNAAASGIFYLRIRECVPDFGDLIHIAGGTYEQYADSVALVHEAGLLFGRGLKIHTYTLSDRILSLRSIPSRGYGRHKSTWISTRGVVRAQDMLPFSAPECET